MVRGRRSMGVVVLVAGVVGLVGCGVTSAPQVLEGSPSGVSRGPGGGVVLGEDVDRWVGELEGLRGDGEGLKEFLASHSAEEVIAALFEAGPGWVSEYFVLAFTADGCDRESVEHLRSLVVEATWRMSAEDRAMWGTELVGAINPGPWQSAKGEVPPYGPVLAFLFSGEVFPPEALANVAVGIDDLTRVQGADISVIGETVLRLNRDMYEGEEPAGWCGPMGRVMLQLGSYPKEAADFINPRNHSGLGDARAKYWVGEHRWTDDGLGLSALMHAATGQEPNTWGEGSLENAKKGLSRKVSDRWQRSCETVSRFVHYSNKNPTLLKNLSEPAQLNIAQALKPYLAYAGVYAAPVVGGNVYPLKNGPGRQDMGEALFGGKSTDVRCGPLLGPAEFARVVGASSRTDVSAVLWQANKWGMVELMTPHYSNGPKHRNALHAVAAVVGVIDSGPSSFFLDDYEKQREANEKWVGAGVAVLKAIGNAGVKGFAGLVPPVSGLISKGGGKVVSLGVDAGKGWVLDYLAGDTKKKLGIEMMKNRERSFYDLRDQLNKNLKNSGIGPISKEDFLDEHGRGYWGAFEDGNTDPFFKEGNGK